MLTIARWFRCANGRSVCWVIVLFSMAALGGCGTMHFEVGTRFNPDTLEQSFKTGVSTRADVKRVLGEPYGRGGALMPFHESDRTVWTYYYERGSFDMGSGETHDQRLYLFVFLAGDEFDGYIWFASKLN